MQVGKVYIQKVSNELFKELSSHYAMSTKKAPYEAILYSDDQHDLLQYITHYESNCHKEMSKLIKLLNKAIDKKVFIVHIHTEPLGYYYDAYKSALKEA